MTRKEFMEAVSAEGWAAELARRGTAGTLGLMNKMARAIGAMAEGEYIAVGRVRPENRRLFLMAARDAMLNDNRFYFSDDYTRFYRARMDSEGNAVFGGSCG